MTLIDLSRNIIFIKTHKTGGTSVEAAFEKSLLGLPIRHHHTFKVTDNGFVTARPNRYFTPLHAPFVKKDLKALAKKYDWDPKSYRELIRLKNHALPAQIREAVPLEFWANAQKITICRNPLDIIFSQFFWENPRAKEKMTWQADLNFFAQNILPKAVNQAIADLNEEITVLRYESLAADCSQFLESVGAASSDLPNFKSGFKPISKEPSADVFWPETLSAISKNWHTYASKFNYKIHGQI